MRYYQCKCGAKQSWGSMPPAQCSWCEKCNSNPAEAPDAHRAERIEHDWDAQPVESDQGGATITRCRFCYRSKSEVETP